MPFMFAEAGMKYAMNLEMKGRPCLVLGGGPVALRKARTLLRAEAAVTVAAPRLTEELADLAAAGRLRWRARCYEETMLAGINPLLAKQGLTLDFSDEILFIGPNRYYIKTTCTIHDTEDAESYAVTAFAREQEQKKGMDEAQITGSTMTYAHKYALMTLGGM